jgi:AhpD family alkylhydroperoxidase
MKSRVAASVPIRAGLDPRLVALVESRASQLNGCAHCLNMHTWEARANAHRYAAALSE